MRVDLFVSWVVVVVAPRRANPAGFLHAEVGQMPRNGRDVLRDVCSMSKMSKFVLAVSRRRLSWEVGVGLSGKVVVVMSSRWSVAARVHPVSC